jgi:hypothetical protein
MKNDRKENLNFRSSPVSVKKSELPRRRSQRISEEITDKLRLGYKEKDGSSSAPARWMKRAQHI